MTKRRVSSRQQEGVSKRKKNVQEHQEGSNIDTNGTLQDMFFADSSEKESDLGNKKELNGVAINDGVVVPDAKKLDKLLMEVRTLKKELEEKVDAGLKAVREELDAGLKAGREELDAGFKAVREKIDAGFKAVREEIDAGFNALGEGMAARKEQQKDSIPKSSKAVSGFAPIRINPLRKGRAARKEQRKDSITKSSKAVSGFTPIPVQVHPPEIEALLKEVTKSTSSEENKSKTKTSSSSKEFSSSSSEEVEEVTIVAPKSFPATTKKGPAPTRRSSRIAGK